MAKFAVIALMLAFALLGGLGVLGTQTTARATVHDFTPANECAALAATGHAANTAHAPNAAARDHAFPNPEQGGVNCENNPDD